MDWLNRKSIASTLVAAAAVGVGAFFWGDHWDHRAQAADDHTLLEQTVATQSQMAELVEVLAGREALGESRARRDLELCDDGKLDDAVLCEIARLEVELADEAARDSN